MRYNRIEEMGNPYYALALAIVLRGVKDYQGKFEERYDDDTKEGFRKDAEAFLLSNWCDTLLQVSGLNRTGKELLELL